VALIEVFRDHGLIPDDRGELPPLTPSQATLIRSCGYDARAGRVWRCPLLPDEHVRWADIQAAAATDSRAGFPGGDVYHLTQAPLSKTIIFGLTAVMMAGSVA